MASAPTDDAEYEVYAIKYAEADALPLDKVAIGADPHESPFDMAYYVWLIRRDDAAIVVDTGFNARSGAKRGRRLLRSPVARIARAQRRAGSGSDADRHPPSL